VPGATVYSVICGVAGKVIGNKTDLLVADLLKRDGSYRCRGTWLKNALLGIEGGIRMGIDGDVTPWIQIVVRKKNVTRVG
jgi:hypothetical protein